MSKLGGYNNMNTDRPGVDCDNDKAMKIVEYNRTKRGSQGTKTWVGLLFQDDRVFEGNT